MGKSSILAELERHIGSSVTIHSAGAPSFNGRLVAVHADGVTIERVTFERKEYGPDRTHQNVTACYIPLSGLSHLTLSFERTIEG